MSLPLPKLREYGWYECEIKLNTLEGKTVAKLSRTLLNFPPTNTPYITSSPLGAHYYNMSSAIINYTGIHWLRNHDVYGRWYYYDDGQGKTYWNDLKNRMDFVRSNKIRECFVLLGAPGKYSTILPGEKIDSPFSPLHSYYPPGNTRAWLKDYVTPVAKMVSSHSPFRAYEILNESWSYYRLRGLRGTPAEAFNYFKESYLKIKKLDPEALVYATDVKIEKEDNIYAYKDFGLDMLELGYLRYNDLVSYHRYGMAAPDYIEYIRKRVWDFGRDFDMWSTETAVAGKPFYYLMESLVQHGACGNGRTFTYNANAYAPFIRDGHPTMYLVTQAALQRYLGDGVFLGQSILAGVRIYYFVNGKNIVAFAFTNNDESQSVPAITSTETTIVDLFGKSYDVKEKFFNRDNPAIIINPSLGSVLGGIADKILQDVSGLKDTDLKKKITDYSQRIRMIKPENAINEVSALNKEIRQLRTSADASFLYESNKVLDYLRGMRLVFARRSSSDESVKDKIADVSQKIKELWTVINTKTGGNGILPNTERLTSRAAKHLQHAKMYYADSDMVAAGIYLSDARLNIADAWKRLPSEKIADVYKTKMYFRSLKRYIRTEVYAFAPGKSQTATLTLANPFTRTLDVSLDVQAPDGWSVKFPGNSKTVTLKPLSRVVLDLVITPSKAAKINETGVIRFIDNNNNFQAITAQYEVLKTVPAYPVLRGGTSKGVYTGN